MQCLWASKVYYGGHENRSREGEGLWFILNPTKTDLTAETYTWENDKPKGDFKERSAEARRGRCTNDFI